MGADALQVHVQSVQPLLTSRIHGLLGGIASFFRDVPATPGPIYDEKLQEATYLAEVPMQCRANSFLEVRDDLAHVRALFSTQVQDVTVLGVYRVENGSLSRVYEAVKGTMGLASELVLWHGTTPESMRNILLGGFNRAYSGRHVTRLGLGTYFSPDAAYSLRFCGKSRSVRHVMLLAKVCIGTCTKGAPDLVEPPYRDAYQMERYDATVDDVTAPSMYCIFRDYRALPCYVVEFTGSSN